MNYLLMLLTLFASIIVNRFVEKICKTSSNGQKSIGSSGSISVADDILVKHPFSNFRDITLLDKPCEVIVLGTIMGVDDKDDWYYLGCEECNRKVETTLVIEDAEDGAEEPKFKQVLVCSNPDCPKEVVAATPIFRIPIRVQDYAVIASLTLFDREARKMLGMTAIQLLEKSKVDQASLEEKTIPYQFKSLNDKKFAFKIQISQFNIDNHIDGYAVHKLVNDAAIIESLESRIPADQGVDEAAADVSLSDMSTQNPFALKDAVDSIGDSFTPACTSKDCSKTSSSELKLNLLTCVVGRSPLSNITNANVFDPNQVEHQDYAECRKLRKLYLDNKRKNANNKSSTSQNVIRSSNVSLSDTNVFRVVTPIRSSSYINTMDGRILPTTPLTNLYVAFEAGRSPLANITKVAYNDVENQKSAERRRLKKLHEDNKRHNVTNKLNTRQNVIRSSNVPVSDTNDCRVVAPIRSSSYINTIDRRILPTTPLTNSYEAYTSVETERSPLGNITNVASNDVEHQQSAERRKYRKLHLDNKRNNVSNQSSISKDVTRSFNVSASHSNECRIVTPMRSLSYINTIDPRFCATTPLTTPSEASTSGVKRKQRGKQRFSTNQGRNVYPIPMVDLSSDDHIIPRQLAEDPYKGVSSNYLDHGDQVVVCDICNAKLWKVEAGKGKVYSGRTTYMLCCAYGKVHPPNFKETCLEYQSLFKSLDDKSKHFLLNIRRFNSMFSFTSMGGKVDSKINRGNAPNSNKPASATSDLLDTELIEYLKVILDSNNELVKTYRRVRDRFVDNPQVDLKLRLKANRSKDGRTYNLPTSSEVAALIVGNIEEALDNRDVVVESKKDGLQRISELHPSYLALQYPLLFPFGEDGYRVDILHREGRASTKKKESKCTTREYFAYHVQDRVNHFSLILNARRLLQQFLVDLGQNGNPDMSNTGTRVLLPSSFTGGSRYMRENYYDAMTI
ncbi:uncharacterized protein LOC110944793 [Helianthus annuus]|uniref:uncharacterized protein LOC110944793 n=1 Tax=Helianthus annuus TaxID=4232 RepID=UPI001652C2E4|nr:uncharacterized protein LOC110944793 [Helianthus annuus]